MGLLKGSPESFDLQALTNTIANLQAPGVTWPVYDRNLHDVSERREEITAPIILIEGNWLLLDEPGWRALRQYCDFAVMLIPQIDALKERLIARKVRGGKTREQAGAHYERCDGPNIWRCMDSRLPADATLRALPGSMLSCEPADPHPGIKPNRSPASPAPRR